MYFIGFDIGGTKIEAMLIHFGKLNSNTKAIAEFEYLKSNGDITPAFIVSKKRVATERHKGYEQIVDKMAQLFHDVCFEQDVKPSSIAGVGLSVPGPIDPITEIITASNSMIVVGHNLHKDLHAKLKLSCPFMSENDANCFALAESLCGAGLEYFKQTKIPVHKQTSVGLILGSGFGGGIVVHGKVMTGRRGGAGEVGHVTLYPNGLPCYCGRQGCAEQYLCGPGLEAALNVRMYSQIQKRPTASEIFDLYKVQDPIALAVIKQYKKDLAFYLGSLTSLLDPHYFVLGGGLSLQDLIYEGLDAKIGENSFLPNEPVKVFKHVIGDSAGAIGAVLVVKENHQLNID
ncbi:MAG: ROK family protein [Bdellovibrionota bacterium]